MEVVVSQRLPKMPIFRIFGRERKNFSTDALLVGPELRIILTNNDVNFLSKK